MNSEPSSNTGNSAHPTGVATRPTNARTSMTTTRFGSWMTCCRAWNPSRHLGATSELAMSGCCVNATSSEALDA